MIEKKPFVSYELDEERDFKGNEEAGSIVVSLKLNLAEQKALIEDKFLLKQTKDGTAIKQLMFIGSKVIHNDLIASINEVVTDNKRKNKRLGIADFDA